MIQHLQNRTTETPSMNNYEVYVPDNETQAINRYTKQLENHLTLNPMKIFEADFRGCLLTGDQTPLAELDNHKANFQEALKTLQKGLVK